MTSGDFGAAGLAVLIFGITMISLYLVVRAGVRAGMEDAWKRAGQTPAPSGPTAPAPQQRAREEASAEETKTEESEATADDHHSVA
jgi:hypothetical protein